MPILTKSLSCFALALVFSAGVAAAARPPAESFTLGNGLSVIVVPRAGDTTIQAGWVMAVGSADERPGETGLAQVVARLLDDGSRTIGSRDPDRERQLLVEADGLRARLPWAEDKAPIDTRLAAIDHELGLIVDSGAFRAIYTGSGVALPRSTVSEDATIFTTALPPGQLELWFRLEAERLKAPVFRRLAEALADAGSAWQTERTLNLAALAELRFRMTAWEGHPYAWPASGLPADLTRLTRRMLEAFQQGLYAPDRATVVLVGPVDPDLAQRLAERYFGSLTPPAKRRSASAKPFLPPGQRSFSAAVDTVPRLVVEYRTPGAAEADSDGLVLLARLLGGTDGRLQQAVNAAGLNASAHARFEPRRQLGSLRVEIAARVAGPDAKAFLAPLDRAIERLTAAPLSTEELNRVRSELAAELDAEMADSARLARTLLVDAGMGQPERTRGLADRLAKLTPADVQRLAAICLVPAARTVGVMQPGG